MAKPAPKAKPKPKIAEAKPFRVIIVCNGTTYEGTGDNFLESIKGINPVFFKTKAQLTAFKCGQRADMLLNPIQTRRLMANQLARELFQKRITNLMH